MLGSCLTGMICPTFGISLAKVANSIANSLANSLAVLTLAQMCVLSTRDVLVELGENLFGNWWCGDSSQKVHSQCMYVV